MSSISIQRILVAIKDPMAAAPASVIKAVQLARALSAELVLFHAIDLPLSTEAYDDGERAIGDDEANIRAQFLHNLTAQTAAAKQAGLSVSVAAEWDYPAHEAVLRYAQRIHADLIVTERHAHSPKTPWGLHSVDWELLRLSTKPVLLVKDPRPYQQPIIVAALDPLQRHAKPTDLDAGICALAETLNSGLRGAWHALHASAGITGVAFDHGVDVRRARALAAMNRLLETTSVKPQTVQLQDLPPAQAILERVEALHASVVVMGAVSRSGLKRLLIGNTAEQVIDQLPCDVLVVKPKRFGIRFSRRPRGAHLLSIAPTPSAH